MSTAPEAAPRSADRRPLATLAPPAPQNPHSGPPGAAVAAPRDVVAAARGFLGVRWHHQGRSSAGLDCAGLVIAVAHVLGLSAFDTRDYGRLPSGQRMREILDAHCARAPALQPGVVALMRFEADPQHLAIVADYVYGGLSLVHALMTERRVCEHRLDTHWRARIVALYALPGVAYAEAA